MSCVHGGKHRPGETAWQHSFDPDFPGAFKLSRLSKKGLRPVRAPKCPFAGNAEGALIVLTDMTGTGLANRAANSLFMARRDENGKLEKRFARSFYKPAPELDTQSLRDRLGNFQRALIEVRMTSHDGYPFTNGLKDE
jgi:hypothetical protein